jgi:uncharacterized protein YjiS (DUF1127 family)
MAAHTSHGMTNHHELPLLDTVTQTLRAWARRHSERTELAAWTERDLNDVGLSRDDVMHEIDKPFWRS